MAAKVAAMEETCLTLSSSNLLNDTQSNVLGSSHPGRKEIIVSETLFDYCYPPAPPEGEKTPCTKSNIPVGGRHFLAQWEHQGALRSILSLLWDGYKLSLRECPNLSRLPCITSGYAGLDKQSAFMTTIQELLHKDVIEVVHTQNSLGFYNRLFLVPKPGNR